MTTVDGTISAETFQAAHVRSRLHSSAMAQAHVPVILVTLVTAVAVCHLRWTLAVTLPWQCDELPLMQRFTALAGKATNEAEAQQFEPSLYTFRKGAVRSLRVPDYHYAVHTSTGFWANLTFSLFGYGTAAGRAGPLIWSLLAIVTAGWAAWLVSRSAIAACLAAWIVALSPFATAYGAQMRGYAEAMALTPLLLIAMEYYRRRPDKWLRAVPVFACAVLTSLTIYTMWVYWALPILVLAICLLPRTYTKDDPRRRVLRTGLALVTVGAVALMTVYTVDRWKQLTFVAQTFGREMDGLAEATAFLSRLVRQLLPWPVLILVLALFGVGVLRRSTLRWWGWAIGVGAIVPAAFAIVNGSAGYVRNLAYLLGPIAILAALGGDRLFRACTGRIRAAVVGVALSLTMLAGSAWAYAGLEGRARAILLPDWGEVVLRLNREPTTTGPRWFCPCLANWWQITWYQGTPDVEAVMSTPPGGSIEVVMGAQRDDDGRPKVFVVDPGGRGIPEVTLPDYIAAVPPSEVRAGIEVRRWTGTRMDPLPKIHQVANEPSSPILVMAVLRRPPLASAWLRFIVTAAGFDRGVVTFKSVAGPGGGVQSLITPAGHVGPIVVALAEGLGISRQDIRVFALDPLDERH